MPDEFSSNPPAPAKPVRLAKGQEVSLGCGTLILIAIIVMFFSSRHDTTITFELHNLQSDVKQLQKSVQDQSSLILLLKEQVEKLKSGK